jgi:hypothetical protein
MSALVQTIDEIYRDENLGTQEKLEKVADTILGNLMGFYVDSLNAGNQLIDWQKVEAFMASTERESVYSHGTSIKYLKKVPSNQHSDMIWPGLMSVLDERIDTVNNAKASFLFPLEEGLSGIVVITETQDPKGLFKKQTSTFKVEVGSPKPLDGASTERLSGSTTSGGSKGIEEVEEKGQVAEEADIRTALSSLVSKPIYEAWNVGGASSQQKKLFAAKELLENVMSFYADPLIVPVKEIDKRRKSIQVEAKTIRHSPDLPEAVLLLSKIYYGLDVPKLMEFFDQLLSREIVGERSETKRNFVFQISEKDAGLLRFEAVVIDPAKNAWGVVIESTIISI